MHSKVVIDFQVARPETPYLTVIISHIRFLGSPSDRNGACGRFIVAAMDKPSGDIQQILAAGKGWMSWVAVFVRGKWAIGGNPTPLRTYLTASFWHFRGFLTIK
jgi:hypothetical protein